MSHIYLFFILLLLSKVFGENSLTMSIHIAKEIFFLIGYLNLPFALNSNSKTLPLPSFLFLDFLKPKGWRCRLGFKGWTLLKPIGMGNICYSSFCPLRDWKVCNSFRKLVMLYSIWFIFTLMQNWIELFGRDFKIKDTWLFSSKAGRFISATLKSTIMLRTCSLIDWPSFIRAL